MPKNYKALVVEDEQLIAMDLEMTLSENGYHVDCIAGDESQALEYLGAHRPDIALLDLHLGPGQLSFGIARRLSMRKIPIIIVSAHSRSSFEVPKSLANAPWVSKPFSDARLIGQLNSVMTSQNLKREGVVGGEVRPDATGSC